MLAPDHREDDSLRYTFFLECGGTAAESLVTSWGQHVEAALCENYHYRHARNLGQLAAAGVFRIEQGGMGAYRERLLGRGTRAGDIKPVALSTEDGWGSVFRGRYL
jgi:hypothetical protein